jgi:hypothetical protein
VLPPSRALRATTAACLLPLLLALAACGPEGDDAAETSDSLSLRSADGRLELKDRLTRSPDRDAMIVSLQLAGAGNELTASVGDAPLAVTRTRTGRANIFFGAHELAAAFSGAQAHLLGAAVGTSRVFATFDVMPSVKRGTGTLALAGVEVAAGGLNITLTSSAALTEVTAAEGTATLDPATRTTVSWLLPFESAAALALGARRVSVATVAGGSRKSTSFSVAAVVAGPHVRAVPQDFDLAYALLAEAPARKIGHAGAPSDRALLESVAHAIGQDEMLALNVARIFVSRAAPAGLTIVQATGAVGRRESWWLPRDELRRRLERTLRSLPFHLVREGER